MYLKNGFFVKNQWFYILPIGLFFLINVNAFFAPEVDLKPLIAQMGELPFFVMNVGIFLIFFLGLFFIVKFIHQQPIVKFTTGRKRIDWGRIFFSFSLWGGYLVLQTGLSSLCCLFPFRQVLKNIFSEAISYKESLFCPKGVGSPLCSVRCSLVWYI